MDIEEKIFQRYSPDFTKFLKNGFSINESTYSKEVFFKEMPFKTTITVDEKGIVKGVVTDTESGEKYLPLRIKNSQGEFVGKVRAEYENILTDIRDKCFIRKYFISDQSNRITEYIINNYNSYPEFLWEKFDGSGIFRNSNTNKWFAAILDTNRNKLQKGKDGIIEVINLKLSQDHVQEIIQQPHFYPAYHMNKKHWISVILDESVTDKTICKLIEESYNFTIKR